MMYNQNNLKLQSKIEDVLIDFARDSIDMTNSDMQGVATVQAKRIIDILENGNAVIKYNQDACRVCQDLYCDDKKHEKYDV